MESNNNRLFWNSSGKDKVQISSLKNILPIYESIHSTRQKKPDGYYQKNKVQTFVVYYGIHT